MCCPFQKKYRMYGIKLIYAVTEPSYRMHLLHVSWPVLIDKSTMALAYIWLCKMLATMGKVGVATFSVVKDMERFALLPAIAFAQVVTFLVSNDFGRQNWRGIKSNIKKIVFIASVVVFATLILFSLNTKFIIHIFDKKDKFTDLAAFVFPILSVLVFFDLLQLILAGALRGSGNVRTVMLTRLAVCLCFFIPASYMVSGLDIQSVELKFILIYGLFYIGNALMCISYIKRFRGTAWREPMI